MGDWLDNPSRAGKSFSSQFLYMQYENVSRLYAFAPDGEEAIEHMEISLIHTRPTEISIYCTT